MNKSLIDQIIADSIGWDEVDGFDVQFYYGVLQMDTVKFKKGEKVPCATFLFSQSILQLWVGEDIIEEIPLKLSLVLDGK